MSEDAHPMERYISADTLPSVWCPGCGIGAVVHTFLQALEESGSDARVISGTGCSGKIAGHLLIESYEVTDQDPVAFGASLDGEKTNVVFTNCPDLMLSGASGLLGPKKNTDLLLIHINNLVYTVSETRAFPASPFQRMSADRKHELPFNIPLLAEKCGASYIARWTPLKAGWLKQSILDALGTGGLRVIEVVSPCVVYDVNGSRMGDGADRLALLDAFSVTEDLTSTKDMDLRGSDKIIMGTIKEK
jgi:2-oxoglutarate ferredoxin oxidoreductase subunit beta